MVNARNEIFGGTAGGSGSGNLGDEDQGDLDEDANGWGTTYMLITLSVFIHMGSMWAQMKSIGGGFQIMYAFL